MENSYLKSKEELFKALGSSESGLTAKKAEENRKIHGENRLPEGKKKSILSLFLGQFADFLVIILIAAAVVSAISGDIESVFVIAAVITMNAVLGTVQTVKAEKSLEGLKRLSAPQARVIREGKESLLPSEEIAAGDIILIEAGDKICADGRILESAALQVNESALTGESLPAAKADCTISAEASLADRTNMVYSGCFVTGGRGKYIVTAVGGKTEVGKIAALINSAKERKTPLQVSLDSFGKRLSVGILIICALVFGLGLFNTVRNGGALGFESVMDSFMFAVALAVAAIPEALSSIVTIVLALGTRKMSAEKAIIRKLQAVEGLGSVSVICSDKTGTITQNRMTVRQVWTEDKGLLVQAAVLCSDAVTEKEKEIGDPTETALLRYAEAENISTEGLRKDCPRLLEIPFDSDRKLMSTVNRVNGERIMFTKGAADVMLDRMDISAEKKRQIAQKTEEFSRLGMRVLCFGCRKFEGESISVNEENNLQFIGLAAMTDPPRKESAEAVKKCKAAGIKPVMITGDHAVTAAAIAKETGILEKDSEVAEGRELDRYSDEELPSFVEKKSVFARVTPEHKIRIVRAWQKMGAVVAMTGDGVNDAPALKQADIGVAMGITGTEAAKDAASMVLADDNFATIVKAVENGRNIYGNIKKSILFLLSGNAAAIIAVLFCSVAGLPLPFEPIHLLFINLLTDSLPAIALGLEPHSPEVMRQPPRKAGEGILTRDFLLNALVYGLIIGAAAISAFLMGLSSSPAAASTMAFSVLCLSRLLHGFSCKSASPVIFTRRMWNNRACILSFCAGLLLLCAVLFIGPLQGLFRVTALTASELISVFLLPLLSFGAVQIFGAVVGRKKR
ncbi:MAG: cation-translocating P-type ATPase [Ruminiclostridium sp.]